MLRFRAQSAWRFVLAFCVCFLLLGGFWLKSNTSKFSQVGPSLEPVDIASLVLRGTTNFPCTTAKVRKMEFPICTYDRSEDIYVSTWFLRGEYWEANYVTGFLNFMDRYSAGKKESLTLVDIGANIGAYSLAAGHAGYKVISAEPNKETHKRLAKSVAMGGIIDRVKIFPNPISDNRDLISLGIDGRNKGDSFVSKYNVSRSLTVVDNTIVRAAILDDLIDFIPNRRAVMKIDAQGSELRILSPATSTRFLTEVDVAIILVEWVYYHVASSNPLRLSPQLVVMLDHLKNMGYEAYEFNGKPITNPDVRQYTGPDVIFKKKGVDYQIN